MNWCNGIASLILQTHLTSNTDVVQPIYYQIFCSMADDAQFAAPNLESLALYGNPLLSEPASLLLDDEDDDTLVAQDGSVEECELPSSSAFCMRNTKFISIMGEPVTSHRVYGESTVFEYTSVKQLSNMLTPMELFKTAATTNFVGRQLNPFATIKFAYTDDMWLCFYNQIRSIYRFGRGSFRMTAIISQSAIQATSYIRPGNDDASAYWTTVTTDPFIGTANKAPISGGFQYFMSTMYMPADIVIPYYSTVPCILYNSNQTAPQPFLSTSSAANIVFSNQATVGLSIMYFGATADDFIFGSRIGMPKLKHA